MGQSKRHHETEVHRSSESFSRVGGSGTNKGHNKEVILIYKKGLFQQFTIEVAFWMDSKRAQFISQSSKIPLKMCSILCF